MKRSQAEKLIDDMRKYAAGGVPHGQALDRALIALLEHYHLTPLERCTGEAHSNAFIDNCMVCAPRWGFVGPREKVT